MGGVRDAIDKLDWHDKKPGELVPYHGLMPPIFHPVKLTVPPKLTGGSSDYYLVDIKNPTSGGQPYVAEVNDIIEALGMTFAEGNIFKALVRSCKARMGDGKPGASEEYDAEKIVFFGNRKLAMARLKG